MSDIADLIDLMSLDQQGHIRGTATEVVLGLSANKTDGKDFFTANLGVVTALVKVTGDTQFAPVAKDAILALTNISSFSSTALKSQMIADGLLESCTKVICDPAGQNADEASMLIANMSRDKDVALKLCDLKGLNGDAIIPELCAIFGKGPAFNPNATYHYLASVLFNVSQTAEGRQQILKRAGEGCVFQRLLPFTTHESSTVRRGGAVGCIRNCCFSSQDHEWLLSDEVNILPALLLPLIGGEELDDEDMDGMPDELQYMDPDKTRESDADMRKMLLETLSQLMTTPAGRQIMRDRKVYPVLREYHKWEPEDDVREACETVVSSLITPEMEDAPAMRAADGDLSKVDVDSAYTAAAAGVEAELNGEAPPPEEKRQFKVGGHDPGYYLKNQADFQVQVGQ